MDQVIENKHSDRKPASPRLLAGIAIVVLALIFVFQNTDKGKIHFFFWDITAPAWAWLLILFGAGVAVGSLFPWLRRKPKPQ